MNGVGTVGGVNIRAGIFGVQDKTRQTQYNFVNCSNRWHCLAMYEVAIFSKYHVKHDETSSQEQAQESIISMG